MASSIPPQFDEVCWQAQLDGSFKQLSPLVGLSMQMGVSDWGVIASDKGLMVADGVVVSDSFDASKVDGFLWLSLSEEICVGVRHCVPSEVRSKFCELVASLTLEEPPEIGAVDTELATSALRRLHVITSDDGLPLSEKIQKILELGCELFDLPFGIVSHVVNDDYTVEYCHSPNGELAQGAVFDLGVCYCLHTLRRNEVTGFFHAGQSSIAEHPCYEVFQLEAYLGVSIHVAGKVWGTLNFSSSIARDNDFSADEYELVKLFGQWVSVELTRERHVVSVTEAEKRHRLILESISDGVVGVDEGGRISFINAAAAQMTGYEAEECIGLPISVITDLPVSDDMATVQSVQDAVVCEKDESFELSRESEFYTKLGQPFPVKYSSTPARGSGQTIHTVLTFQDITEQRAVASELTKQMEMFRSLFVDAPEAIVVVGTDRIVQMVNPRAVALFGYQESEMVGKSAEWLYADLQDYEAAGEWLERSDLPDRGEYRMNRRRSDGTIFTTENVRSKIFNQNGELSGFIVHVRDIEERLAIEADIRKAQDRLSIATLSAGIGVWEVDIASSRFAWDHQMAKLYGLEVDEGLDCTLEQWLSFLHPDDRDRVEAASEYAVRSGQDLDVDFRIIRGDGDVRHIKANARLALDERGNPSSLYGVNYDITERYLTESILKKAREEAIRASQAKSNFLATMSHEIRTPLNGVLGMAEILAGTELNERQQYQLGVIRNSGETLLELINEILDFSKIEAGHLSLELIDFDLEKLTFDLTKLLVVRAEEKGVDLLVKFDLVGTPVMQGDAYRIRQILTNLIGNAIKFTHEGEVVVRVGGGFDTNRGCFDIEISVSDTGIGIASDALANVFSAFTQADNSTTRKFGGTGLGLAITKQLVDMMGGSISVNSTLGKGTEFVVHLTLGESSGPVRLPHIDADYDFSNILVIDDNETNLSILASQLDQCGLQAQFVNHSVSGLNQIIDAGRACRPYDLIILDYLMPELDGLAVSRMIRESLPEDKWPKVLMISSAGALHTSQLKEAGIHVCINKPTSVNELKAGLKAAGAGNTDRLAVMVASAESRVVEDLESGGALSGLKILVVEDMKANLAVAQGMLSQLGAEVIYAENGALGVEAWAAYSPDVILMDLHMPVMDGLTAIKEIRRQEQDSEVRVPIFALTADIQPERAAQVESAGGDGYISKPFKRTELLETISNRLFNEIEMKPTGNSGSVVHEEEKMIESEALDRSVLAGLEEVLGDQVNEIIAAFVLDARNVFQAFDQAISASEGADALRGPAHSLKSVSANVGAMHLSALASALEQDVLAGGEIDSIKRVEELRSEFGRVKESLVQLGKVV